MMKHSLIISLWRRSHIVLLLLVAFSAAFSPAVPAFSSQAANPAGPATSSNQPPNPVDPLTDPTIVVNEPVNTYTITDGLLYWAYLCYGGEFRSDGYLRRKPSHGGAINTLQITPASACVTFWRMAADSSGVYYANIDGGKIEYHPTSNPTATVALYTGGLVSMNMTDLALDDTYVYWGDTFTNIIYRLPKTGGIPTPLRTDYYGGLSALVRWYGWLFWLDNSGLWYCTTPDCASASYISGSAPGRNLIATPQGMFYIETSNPQQIHYAVCVFGCGDWLLYTATANWTISSAAPGLCADGSNCLYWAEYGPGAFSSRLQRRPFWSGTPETIADLLPNGNEIATDDQGVYFYTSTPWGYLGRLPFTATVVQRDIRAAAWEVTQGNQSLSNDVPLVAGKTTYVRLYPALADTHANFVQAALYGWRSGSPLPGSPLAPLGGTIDLDSAYTYDRADQYSGYLFQLPDSWTNAGDVTLQATVDPNGIYADQNPANNSLSSVVTFGNKPPVCDVFIPIRTNTPPASVNAPNFWRMIDLYKRLWPVPDVWVYYESDDISEPEFCWKWGFIPWSCDGPFELNEGSSWSDWIPDQGEALLHVSWRATFTDDPDECAGPVHYVGMVYPTAPTGDTEGLAYIHEWMEAASWVKLPPPTFDPPLDFTWPRSGSTLAHETSHNHERGHVDCGGPDDPDYSYPYPPCQLDDAIDPTHFGFDINLRDPIAPADAADYMSYAWNRWASDYTYRAMYGHVAEAQAASSTVLSVAANAVLVSAQVNTGLGTGNLDYAWVYPTSAVSQNMLGKWEKLLAQPFNENMINPEVVNYHLRLLDASSASLGDYTLTPLDMDEYADQASNLIFQQSFAAPGGTVARLDLMADETVLMSRQVGTGSPVVNILTPAGGEVFDDSMVISWQASDPDDDRLLFNLQYSPDGGLTWKSVAESVGENTAGDTNAIELDDLGSLGASLGATGLIRVAASDGYHTTLATSNAFTVANQPPQAYIISPELTHIYPAGENVLLRGGASDPETGGLSGNQLVWTINGVPAGVGEENSVDGVAPGSYFTNLTATDPDGITSTVTTLLNIGRLVIPTIDTAPLLDGSCEDTSYGDLVMRLKPDGFNNQAFAALTRTADGLWACFSGMRYIEGRAPGAAGLLVDVNASADWLAQPDDYAFLVGEDGTPMTYAGDGAGGFNLPGPAGVLAQVGVQGTTWSAELYIPASVVGGWNHPIGLDIVAAYNWISAAGQKAVPDAAALFSWPYASLYISPFTWGRTLLGNPPVITSLNPDTATAGGATFTLTIQGEGFEDGAVANWSGTNLPTTFVSSSQLTAQVDASLITASAYVLVSVTNPNLLVSDPAIFTVENPTPVINALSPRVRTVGTEAFTLTVMGSGFVEGSVIVWDGEVLETTFVDSSHLQAIVAADRLADVRNVTVVVKNPEPSAASSNLVTFSIEGLRRYLPVILRH